LYQEATVESEIGRYLYELGQLKRVRRSGWWLAGIRSPESVADHTFRSAAIAYLLALLEGANPERAAVLALFHDSAETRINDLHRLGKRYLDWTAAEGQAHRDQTSALPPGVRDRLVELFTEYTGGNTPESRIARDADRLECLIQAREYREEGYRTTDEWIESSRGELRTDSARRLAAECLKLSPGTWRT